MSRRIKQWEAELRKIKRELPDELRIVNRRIIRNQRHHGRVDPDFLEAKNIRTECMRKEQNR